MSSSPAPAAVAPHAASTPVRDWFLRDSRWEDDQWILAPTNAMHEDRPVVLRWDFSLRDGQFTHRRYAALLESARQHVALFRVGSTLSRSGCGARSLQIYFQCLRTLIRWMIQEEVRRFADLDAEHIADFSRAIRRRRGYTGPTISRETLTHYYGVLIGPVPTSRRGARCAACRSLSWSDGSRSNTAG